MNEQSEVIGGQVDATGFLANQKAAMIVIGVLLNRIGGSASISQKDIDEVSFCQLHEFWNENGDFGVELVELIQIAKQ